MPQVNEMHPRTVRMPNGSVEIVNDASDRYLTRQEIFEIKTAPDATTEDYILAHGNEVAEPNVITSEDVAVTEVAAEAEIEAVAEPVAETDVAVVAEVEPVAEVVVEEIEEASEETDGEEDHASGHRKSRRK